MEKKNASERKDSSAGKKKGVLIVDDEPEVCFLLCTYLLNKGYTADYCLTLRETRARLEKEKHDILVLDINLEDGNGLSLLEENVIPEETKTIVISAYEHKREEALGLGARLFISKPFSVNQILETIESLRASA